MNRLFSLIYVTVLSALLFPFLLQAQNLSFTVLTTSGKVQINTAGKWRQLNTGDNISSEFKIKLDKNSYAGIICSNGRSLELTKPGIVDCAWLRKQAEVEKSTSGKKFAGYIFGELTKGIENTSPMKVTGAVVRERLNNIPVAVPSPACIIDSEVVFRWFPSQNSQYYYFKILNPENKTLYLKRVQDTSIAVNFYSLQLEGRNFKWLIINYDKPEELSDTNTICLMNSRESSAIMDSLAGLNEALGNNETALSQIVLASFYERNNLNINAMEAYKKAVILAPKVKVYRIRFNDFLKSRGLDNMIE